MDTIKDFGSIAKDLSRNPLGIIALFLVFTYAVAALIVGCSDKLQSTERSPLIWLLVLFPPFVLIVFSWLVSCHHDKLYAPTDYRDDNSFLETTNKLRTLKETSAQTESEEFELSISPKITSNQILEDYIQNPNPQMAFIQMYIEIEKIINSIAKANNLFMGLPNSIIPIHKIIKELVNRNLIDKQTYSLIRDVMPIRNRIVHGQDVVFTMDMIEIGSRILSILKNKYPAIIDTDVSSA